MRIDAPLFTLDLGVRRPPSERPRRRFVMCSTSSRSRSVIRSLHQ